MPVRNEAAFIERSLGAVLQQQYPPDHFDILIIDGASNDGTPDLVYDLANQYPEHQVRLLNNPYHIVPLSLNLGLRQAQGEVIIRVDGHCEVPRDYIQACLDALSLTGANCVGGGVTTLGETPVAQAIALAQSSLFGVGDVAFRTGRKKGQYVDTVAFGAYRREVFDRIGLFDEELMRNQDDEFNFRLTQAGGKIWMDPSIRSVYYSRASLRKLWRQYYQYGVYKVRVMQKRRAIPSWRHLVPAGFIMMLLGSFILAGITSHFRWALAVIGPYLVATGVASLFVARQAWRTLLFLPVAFFILHTAYGVGFLWGLWKWRSYFGMQTPVTMKSYDPS